MTPAMDLDHNHTMDWFFNPFVYGTALPNYKVESTFENGANGVVMLDLTLTQSNVSDNFKMLVPLYLELPNGNVAKLGSAPVYGNRTIKQQISLGHMAAPPKRAMVNYMFDVLSTDN